MAGSRDKVVVAMSGGVDSSVAACLLVEQGYDVTGLFMRVGVDAAPDAPSDASPTALGPSAGAPDASAAAPDAADSSRAPEAPALRSPPGGPRRMKRGCCSATDAADARFVAGVLGIPFYALNFKPDFDGIIAYFADEYARGRTPNPCVVCNDRLKFGKLLAYADAIGARYVATGHYARIGRRDDAPVLMRGVDRRKDQSYVLFGLGHAVLDRVLFPIGGMAKHDVRRIAARWHLPNQNKPDSVEICFVPGGDYTRVVRRHRPDAFVAGNILNADGDTVGRHAGVGHFTIGQRRGVGVSGPHPLYVTRLDVASRTVTIGPKRALLHRTLLADRVNMLAAPPGATFRADAQIRYLHSAAPATVHVLGDGRMRVVFDAPQSAITPGQAVVLYDRDVVLGGGWIDRVLGAAPPDTVAAASAGTAPEPVYTSAFQ
ncbi:MAG: tRNA 2-thiouridine(34) synthase MnmA [Phycisphaerae bacterium]